ncbi:GDP-mannose 4,6-dehydratase [Nocardioides dongkuii]|uniref:GDP-mannose 4,6-dehydratase n=1 Tax=Nocardioides dongkuii TaxID=2760089 RepID=UPI001877AB4C|nr:GDP-mannose 4,6-dehydratase [Nocardioides dongkuii]
MSLASGILITGVGGFVGRHLVKELTGLGCPIFGIGSNDLDPGQAESLDDYIKCDLRREWPTVPSVGGVVHLAGLSAVGPSFDDPQRYIDSNSAIMTHLGEYYLQSGDRPRTLVVSSGAIYDADQPLPIAESGRLAFDSPYAVSKLLVEAQSSYYARRGLDCVIVRPFNHIGPGQGPGFLLPDLLSGAQAAVSGSEELVVGDLETERDYSDVRDVTHAYRLLLEAEVVDADVVNVCSGQSVAGRTILQIMLDTLQKEIKVRVDPERIRPTDPRRIAGDNSTLRRLTGWAPRFTLEQTISDFISHSTRTDGLRDA